MDRSRPRPPVRPRRTLLRGRPGEVDHTERATSRMLSLWIDLLRQSTGNPASFAAEAPGGLGRQYLNALDLLGHGPQTSRSLAVGLGVSPAAARSAADHLVGLGLVVRSGDGSEDSSWILSTTAAGVQLVARDRRAQLASLRRLLGQLSPARLLVMRRAMTQLARAFQPLLPLARSTGSGPAQLVLRPPRRHLSSPPGGPLGRRDSGFLQSSSERDGMAKAVIGGRPVGSLGPGPEHSPGSVAPRPIGLELPDPSPTPR